MAQGMTTRNNLSMRNPDDVEGSLREVKRWADRLPLGAAGFYVYNSANQVVNGPGVQSLIVFNTVIEDRERWFPGVNGTNQTSFKVPPGLSGVYSFYFGAYHNANIAGMYYSINVNGFSFSMPMFGTPASDRGQASGQWRCKDGDVITVNVLNNSAGNQTINAVNPNVNNPRMPFLSAWRISLL